MHDVNRGKDWTKMFCKSLREDTIEIISFEKKEMILSPNKKYISYHDQENYHIWKETFEEEDSNNKKYCRVGDHCH